MKVIIDTNVVVSAALRDRDPEKVILFVAERADFQWVVSDPILEEYNEVLSREKFALPGELLRKWHEMFEGLTTTIDVDVKIGFPRDPKDAKFLECALASDAEYLITGGFLRGSEDSRHHDHLRFALQLVCESLTS